VNLSLKLFLCLIDKALCYEDTCGSGGTAPPFLISATDKGEWSASLPGRFTSGETVLDAYRIGGWVGPSSGLEVEEKRKTLPLPGFEPRSSNPYNVAVPTELSWFLNCPCA
jgi:hypothetical protein